MREKITSKTILEQGGGHVGSKQPPQQFQKSLCTAIEIDCLSMILSSFETGIQTP